MLIWSGRTGGAKEQDLNIVWSIFPKFYQHLDVKGLAGLVREVGLDTTNMVVRDGYWVTPGNLAAETKAFVQAMDAEGIEIHFASAGLAAEQLREDDSPLAILADNGIREFRMGYFGMGISGGDVRGALSQARGEMESMAQICRKRGVRAVYQVHHGTLATNSMAAWQLVRDLPAVNVGVMLDPGNQGFEGHEDWRNAAALLGEHLVAIGVKDTAPARDPSGASRADKGWGRNWATIDQGTTNWHALLAALGEIDFDGTFVFMPFYDADEDATVTAKLKREVAYLRAVAAAGG